MLGQNISKQTFAEGYEKGCKRRCLGCCHHSEAMPKSHQEAGRRPVPAATTSVTNTTTATTMQASLRTHEKNARSSSGNLPRTLLGVNYLYLHFKEQIKPQEFNDLPKVTKEAANRHSAAPLAHGPKRQVPLTVFP